jgi:hypothetical protein
MPKGQAPYHKHDKAHLMPHRLKPTHGMSRTRTYFIWKQMVARCSNPKLKDYPSYGGRGIAVSEEWRSFENFYRDMGERPPGLSIDRIDNDKGYCKENCKWATRSEQRRNRRDALKYRETRQ